MITKKRIFGILLSLALVLGLMIGMSATAYAEPAGTGISSLPEQAGTYYLTQDITIDSTWSVPSGTTTLDLNGHGIRMTQTNTKVIVVGGGANLTLNDSNPNAVHKYTPPEGGAGKATLNESSGTLTVNGGYITGGDIGNDESGGAAIYVSGTLTMNGGVLIGNYGGHGGTLQVNNGATATIYGGKITYNGVTWQGTIRNQGTLKIYGGEITHNKSNSGNQWHAGGVFIANGSSFYLHGSPLIANNIGGSRNDGGNQPNNVCLEGKMKIDGSLTNTTRIGITMNLGGFNGTTKGEFTDSLDTQYNDASKFASDDTRYYMSKNASTNQLEIGPGYDVLYEANGATSGSVPIDSSAPYNSGATVTVLGNTGNLIRTGYTFGGWNSKADGTGTDYAVSSTFTINTGVTLYAKWVQHIHSFTYAANGATITATCSVANCTLTDSKATQTIEAPTITTYGQTGEGISASATLTGLSDFNAATGKTIATTDIKYVGRDSTTYAESTTAPTGAGKYTAKITVEGKTASVDYEIAKADPTAAAPTATATYGQTLADVTLTNPDGNTAGTWAWVDSTTNVGTVGDHTFKANFTPTDTTNYNSKSDVDVTVTVVKAANPATVTGTASVTKGGNTVDLADNVTLNGAAGDVSYEISGEANGCSLNGSVLTSGANTGSVIVNVTVAADDNYNALAATPIAVTITDKQTQTITASDVTATYGDTGVKIEASTTGDGALSYAVKDGSADYIDVDASTGALTIKKVGTVAVIVAAEETATHAQATKEVTVTIDRANAVAATVTANNRIYDGTEKPLVTVDDSTLVGGTMVYALGTDAATAPADNLYTTSIPAKTNAGTYYVWYKVLGDSDHNPSPVYGPMTVVIKPAPAELTEDEKPQSNAPLTYIDGVEQKLVTAPKKLPEGYTVQYSLGGGETWTDEIPTGMESGDYTVSVQYIGDDNHITFRGEDIEVTIGRAMEMQVDFIILRYNGTRGLPEEIDELTISPVIHVKNGDDESVSKGLELELTKGMESKVSVENVEFTGKVTDPAPGKYEVTVTGLPKSVFGRDKIYWTEGPVEGPVKWKYDLIAKGEINEKDKKIVVTVYLIFDDGSRPDEIKVYALPEDEIGAYRLNDDGTKEYLLFHTYGICMQWLGQDELCRGYERCFHKESPFVNPFVK